MLSLLPDSTRGPIVGLASLGMAGGMLLITWLLLKPLFATSQRAGQGPAGGK
jgi:hypothetical protein